MPQGFDGRVSENGIPLRYGENMPFGFDGRMSPDGIPLREGENMPDEENQYQRYKEVMSLFGYDVDKQDGEVEDANRSAERQGLTSEARNPLLEFLSALLFKQ